MYFYDERHQGKGADALCSLRLRHLLAKIKQNQKNGICPKLSMTLLDNCVGQNKSQVVMKFACFISLFFYETVALMYFLPGHTHMIPDRIVADCKNAIKGLNLYTLGQITEQCNKVKNVNAVLLKPDDSDSPFRVNWGSFLNKHFRQLPSGYTENHFFEFSGGCVTFRRLATTPDSEASYLRMINPTPGTKTGLLMELFGKPDLGSLSMLDLTLPVNPGRTLTQKKLKSLAQKYRTIPDCHIEYYPKYIPVPQRSVKQGHVSSVKRKRDGPCDAPSVKRKVGRPKKVIPPPKGLRSITTYFRSG